MTQSELVLIVLKLLFGGAQAFCAVLAWNKRRGVVWSCLLCGSILWYAGCVYDVLCAVGIAQLAGASIGGVPLLPLFFTIVPPACFIAAFIIKTAQKE